MATAEERLAKIKEKQAQLKAQENHYSRKSKRTETKNQTLN